MRASFTFVVCFLGLADCLKASSPVTTRRNALAYAAALPIAVAATPVVAAAPTEAGRSEEVFEREIRVGGLVFVVESWK